MILSPRHVEIVESLYNLNIPLARGNDDDRRTLTRMIAEQMRFEFGIDWGTKSTSSTSPQSKDAIAFRINPTRMDVWDWQNGTTREPQVHAGQPPDFPNISGQHFIEVQPVNHLGDDPPSPIPPDDNCCDELKEQHDAILAELSDLSVRFDNLEQQLARIETSIEALTIKPSVESDYEGRVLWQNVTLRPIKRGI